MLGDLRAALGAHGPTAAVQSCPPALTVLVPSGLEVARVAESGWWEVTGADIEKASGWRGTHVSSLTQSLGLGIVPGVASLSRAG